MSNEYIEESFDTTLKMDYWEGRTNVRFKKKYHKINKCNQGRVGPGG